MSMDGRYRRIAGASLSPQLDQDRPSIQFTNSIVNKYTLCLFDIHSLYE
jgi:hypothetical protein